MVCWHEEEDLMHCGIENEDNTFAMGVDGEVPPFTL